MYFVQLRRIALNEHAVDFIIRMVHKYPGEVTLWAGGPLTNIALAIRQDPEVVSLAKQLVLMGSGFNVGMEFIGLTVAVNSIGGSIPRRCVL